jgi:hypothetical protein
MTTPDDRKRSIDAEFAVRFVQDQKRLIDAMAPVSKALSEPLAERKRVNHFTEEYEDLYRRKR